MSDDVNKDIQKAIQDAKGNISEGAPKNNVSIPLPNVLKHGLEQSDVVIPAPTFRQDCINE